MPISPPPLEPLTQKQSWVRGERAFPPPPAKLKEGIKSFSPPLA